MNVVTISDGSLRITGLDRWPVLRHWLRRLNFDKLFELTP